MSRSSVIRISPQYAKALRKATALAILIAACKFVRPLISTNAILNIVEKCFFSESAGPPAYDEALVTSSGTGESRRVPTVASILKDNAAGNGRLPLHYQKVTPVVLDAPVGTLPILVGYASFENEFTAFLTEKPGGRQIAAHVGTQVGEFSIAAMDLDSITFDHDGLKITRNVREMLDAGRWRSPGASPGSALNAGSGNAGSWSTGKSARAVLNVGILDAPKTFSLPAAPSVFRGVEQDHSDTYTQGSAQEHPAVADGMPTRIAGPVLPCVTSEGTNFQESSGGQQVIIPTPYGTQCIRVRPL